MRRMFDKVYHFLCWNRLMDKLNMYDTTFAKWLEAHGESHKLCNDCCCLADVMEDPDDDKWRPLFIRICRSLGIDKKSASVLWSEIGSVNNWKHLWLTEEEEKYTVEEWKNMFTGELWYCSDRWSFDRLLRTQWMYKQWCNKFG